MHACMRGCTAGALAPSGPLQQDILHEAPMLGPVAPLLLKSKRVQLVQGQIKYFTDRSAVLVDGSILQPDVVLYATGYTAHYEFLAPETRAKLSVQDDGLYLYRSMMHPSMSHLAFIGAEVRCQARGA